MKFQLATLAAIASLTAFPLSAGSVELADPANIPQVSAPPLGGAYIQQMPEGARPVAPVQRKARPASPKHVPAARTAAAPQPAQSLLPGVGAGVAVVLRPPARDAFFPSVGPGTVRR